jgi:hypothetical protein
MGATCSSGHPGTAGISSTWIPDYPAQLLVKGYQHMSLEELESELETLRKSNWEERVEIRFLAEALQEILRLRREGAAITFYVP